MGDRGNVLVGDAHSRVFLYMHYGASELPLIVKKALSKRDRWDDAPYLARIVFSHMIMIDEDTPADVVKAELRGTTGYGIATYMPDNQHAVIYLDTEEKKVSYISHETATNWSETRERPLRAWTMEDYVNAPDDVIIEAFD